MDFYFAYWGNKRKEITHLLPYIDFSRYDTFCEPCGRSLAFSRYVFHFHPNKQFLCSDVDKNTNRRFVGWEKEETYYKIALERL